MCYNIGNVMTNDDKILRALEDLQAGQKALQTDVNGLKSAVTTIKDVQQEQGKRLGSLEAGQQALELKVEAIHAYQKKAHDEIMGHVLDITEIGECDQKILEKRIERIEKHLQSVACKT
jgi:chromosome segregation ATPase